MKMLRKSSDPNKFHMVLRSHRKREETSITILPLEIMFKILILLPAVTLYNVTRYVCRQWYNIIQDPQFVSAHHLLPTTTLLVETEPPAYHTVGVSRYQILDVSGYDASLTAFEFQLPHSMYLSNSHNGLLLIDKDLKRYYIGNPITRRILALPKLSSFMRPRGSSLVFEPSSKVYKVMLVFMDLRFASEPILSYRRYGCAILTVGVDKAWRLLNLTHLGRQDMRFLLEPQYAVLGFVYWLSGRYRFALDVEYETVGPIAIPYDWTPNFRCHVNDGNSISVMISNPDLSIEGFELKDHRSQEWVKKILVEGEPIRSALENVFSHDRFIVPVTLIGNDDKILIRVVRSGCRDYHIVYDLHTHAFFEVVPKHDGRCWFFSFIPSLAWI